VACRFEVRGTVADYCSTAGLHLAPGGVFACVFPIQPGEQRERVFSGAAAAGLAVVRMRPVVLCEGESPLLGLFLMHRATDLPPKMRERTWTEPPLVIRAADGSVHPEYAAVKLAFGFPP
jgi:tRNA1(Val) A37 N6-methylase TrmN6